MTVDSPIPQTQYADSDGLSIAYQVFGGGTQNLVLVPGIVSHLEAYWEDPDCARMLRRLAQSFRVIVFDKRGQGLSDQFDGAPTLEERMDDVRAVMRAAAASKAVLFAQSEGGAMAALFAATFPEVVERLILFGAFARFTSAPDYPHRRTRDEILAVFASWWGKPEFAARFAPSRAQDPEFCSRFAKHMRMAASPGAVRRLVIANDQIDVRPILPQIRRPTLIVQRRDDAAVDRANGRYLSDHVPKAVYMEIPGVDHLPWVGDSDTLVDAIAQFADANRARTVSDEQERFVTTLLFTDIVGSTEIAGKLGDAKWRNRLQQFHALGRRLLEAHRGREIDTSGDGLFAIFDGPARAIRCAQAISREAKTLELSVRAGLHTGEVEPTGEKVSGMAVHVGARVMALADADEVLVSQTVRDLVSGSGLTFEDRGSHSLKGVPGEWRIFCATSM